MYPSIIYIVSINFDSKLGIKLPLPTFMTVILGEKFCVKIFAKGNEGKLVHRKEKTSIKNG